MGFDVQGIKFLLGAQRSGVSFARPATLGRQELFISPRLLRQLLRRVGAAESAGLAERLLTEAGGYAEPLLQWLGGERIVSIDASSYEGATVVHDMNLPIPDSLRGTFSAVIDGGTLEHIFNYPVAIKNCMEMLEVGGHVLLMTPANNFVGHGFYQFSPELFFRLFSDVNGFEVRRAIFAETTPEARWYEVVDPAKAGRRVELINRRPAYLLIQARKLRQVPVLESAPQQSDYTVLWKEPPRERSPGGSTLAALPGRVVRGASRRLAAAVERVSPIGLPLQKARPDAEVFIEVNWLP